MRNTFFYFILLMSSILLFSACSDSSDESEENSASIENKSESSQMKESAIIHVNGSETFSSVQINSTVNLNAKSTNSATNNISSYEWTLHSKPAGSQANLGNTNTPKTAFNPDVAGDYLVGLSIEDEELGALENSVLITVVDGNSIPVAVLEEDKAIYAQEYVDLDASNSFDADGDTLEYIWRVISVPKDANATLLGEMIENLEASHNVVYVTSRGKYVIGLVVYDGFEYSDEVTITLDASMIDLKTDDKSFTITPEVRIDYSPVSDEITTEGEAYLVFCKDYRLLMVTESAYINGAVAVDYIIENNSIGLIYSNNPSYNTHIMSKNLNKNFVVNDELIFSSGDINSSVKIINITRTEKGCEASDYLNLPQF